MIIRITSQIKTELQLTTTSKSTKAVLPKDNSSSTRLRSTKSRALREPLPHQQLERLIGTSFSKRCNGWLTTSTEKTRRSATMQRRWSAIARNTFTRSKLPRREHCANRKSNLKGKVNSCQISCSFIGNHARR